MKNPWTDLVRVKGIGSRIAELFVLAGVAENVQDLCWEDLNEQK